MWRMRRWNRVVLTLLATIGLAVPARAVTLDVYILTGQSNSLGVTELDLPNYWPAWSSVDANAKFFWSNTMGGYPPDLFGDSGGAIDMLQMQQGGGDNPKFWGPEFGFLRTMGSAGLDVRNILVIKASRSGGGNTYWDKSTFESDNSAGHMWGHLRDTVNAGLNRAISDGYQVNVKGLLYLQGESNSHAEALMADTRLSNLIANLRQHINANYNNAASGMKTVVGEIANSMLAAEPDRALTAGLQRLLADSRSDIALFQTRDQDYTGGGGHFAKDAKLVIGQRYANAFLDLQSRSDLAVAQYRANLAELGDAPHPTTQGWTETGNADRGLTPDVVLASTTDSGTVAWKIKDDSTTYSPGYRQPLGSANFQSMFDKGWEFTANVKVLAGSARAAWSVTAANAPAGWDVAGGNGNISGFQIERVGSNQFKVQLCQNDDLAGVTLEPGSADEFHTLKLVGQAGSDSFSLFVDGQFQGASTIVSGAGLAGFTDIAMFDCGAAGTGQEVLWNSVSLTVLPEPGASVLLITGILGIGAYGWCKRKHPAPITVDEKPVRFTIFQMERRLPG